MTKLIRTVFFWQKVKDTAALFGTGGQILLIMNEAGHHWMVGEAVVTMLVYALGIWMVDVDKNGIVDIFQDELPNVNDKEDVIKP